ncbi:EamA family transporter [Streptomyces sp. NPDC058240]|uniref:EamA family transporter n=1 Tax=Streptomyces sp. NPDC058240 TaxID=3346396 RepID=UPI0036E4C358
MTALFAQATSLLWGLADFGGGLFTRRVPALTVVVVSQAAAAVALGVIVIATGGWSEVGPQLWFAVAVGVVGPVAMLCFYKALALIGLGDVAANGTYLIAAQRGPVTVAAVLASLYPVVTALAARGVLKERLRGVQVAGAGLALVGTVLLATG